MALVEFPKNIEFLVNIEGFLSTDFFRKCTPKSLLYHLFPSSYDDGFEGNNQHWQPLLEPGDFP